MAVRPFSHGCCLTAARILFSTPVRGSPEEDALEKLKYDLYYVKHRSFLLDLNILVQTVEVVLFGKGR